MITVRTSTCGRHGHPEFRLAYDPAVVVVVSDVEWLLGWLESSVAEGAQYRPDETCQIGWGVAEVRLHESGDLTLWEPDMQSMPIEWREGVSATLAQLRLQKDVVQSVLDVEDLLFPSLLEAALICNRLGRRDDIVMERSEPEGSDSGWYCGCRDADHDHNDPDQLLRVSLYEAASCYAPGIIPFAALPPGVLVDVARGVPEVFQEGTPLTIRPNSYLAARYGIS
jgi:hypothetical protein